jgi:hypothetical protein
MTSRITSKLKFFPADGTWHPITGFEEVVGVAIGVASGVQLKRATDGAGLNAANIGALASGATDNTNVAHANAIDFGATGTPAAPIPFTHVSAVITGAGAVGILVLASPRYSLPE